MKYTVRSGSRKHKLEVPRGADFSRDVVLDVGKKTFSLRIHDTGPNGEVRSVAVNNKIMSVQFRRRPDGFPYKVIVNGTAYPVEIERVETTRYKPPVPERKIDGRVRANLPGQISRVLVEAGERVKQGQILLVLEAMKMENEIAAPIEGVVAEVSIKQGQLISKGDQLVVVE
jgi:glutaconyl-CoA/methylmalonyl-CoA decarboxylase subunit gamma